MKLLRALCAGLLMVLAGCSSARIEDYNDKMPVFDIRSYLNGHIEAWGMFVDNAGKAGLQGRAWRAAPRARRARA